MTSDTANQSQSDRAPIVPMSEAVGKTYTVEKLYEGVNKYGSYTLGFTSEGVTLGFSPNAARQAKTLALPSKVTIESFVSKRNGKTGYGLKGMAPKTSQSSLPR